MPKDESITTEYLKYHETYIKKYGEKSTLVLMQVGSFYEAYATNTRGPKLSEIANMLNIVCTRRDKSISEINEKNPYMMGFNLISSQKFINLLINNGYTLIMIDQVTPPPHPERKVTNIYSPSTYIENISTQDNNYTACIYFEEELQKSSNNLLCTGMSAIDLSIGKCYIHETHSDNTDQKLALDETVRFINSLNPSEIIIYYQEKKNGTPIDKLVSYLELGNKCYFVRNTFDKKYLKPSFQNEFLGKIYKNTGLLTPIEYLDIDRLDYARTSFILLLEFAHEHNENIINDISKPDHYMDSNNLILANNAIYQLNIVESNIYNENINSKYKCLFDVVNNTSTPQGRRYLKDRLVSPLISHTELNNIYNNVDELLNKDLNLKIDNHLKGISDIERLEKKMSSSILHPFELVIMIESCEELIEIYNILIKYNVLQNVVPENETIEKIKSFLISANKNFEIRELKMYSMNNITNSFFKAGIHKDLDKLKQDMKNSSEFMNELCKVLCEYIDDTGKKFRREKIIIKKGNGGDFLSLSKARASTLRENLQCVDILTVGTTELKVSNLVFDENNKNNVKITVSGITNSDESSENEEQISELTKKYYIKTLSQFYKDYHDSFKVIIKFISYVDYIKSNAKSAILYNYKRPIINHDPKSSFIECKQLRHPIIERIIDYEYVPHDINLGKDLKGMLLYGLNSSGKCFNFSTPIMMHSGHIKFAKDIQTGDKLMGDDSTPRTVLGTTRGRGLMYKIVPTKGESFTVNGPHILCLKSSGYKHITWIEKENRYKVKWFNNIKMNTKSFTVKNQNKQKQYKTNYATKESTYQDAEKFLNNVQTDEGEIIEISVDDYMKKNTAWKDNYYLYRVGVDFSKQLTDIDPYILGYWLGNGTNNASEITTENPEVVEYYRNDMLQYGLMLNQRDDFHYGISTGTFNGPKGRNHFINTLRKYKLYGRDCKYIPDDFKHNSRQNRLKLLAGIIDSNGCCSNDYGFDICLKSKTLLEDIIYIARSLGYACYLSECERTCTNAPGGPKTGIYYRTYISGSNFDEIPLLLKYKMPKKQKSIREDVLITSFKVEPQGMGDYCGFETDKNKRFLFGDFTVTHNSSLMKATGLALIMAQAGLFVPANEFIYSPYTSLYTRVTSNDNLLKGLSSFSVEMLELKAILQRTGPKTLVIGDEVCRGTEHISAISIVASTIIHLSQLDSSFMFATHLHEIATMDRITKLKNVKSFHISVEYDNVTDSLIYDRVLKPGSGESVYGITFAKYIIQNKSFIELAIDIKNELMKKFTEFISGKKSRYCSDLLVYECQICGKEDQKMHISPLETHHINFQKDCQDGFSINKPHIQKNSKANLIVLCNECHDKIHTEDISVEGYVMTSEGKSVIVKHNSGTKVLVNKNNRIIQKQN